MSLTRPRPTIRNRTCLLILLISLRIQQKSALSASAGLAVGLSPALVDHVRLLPERLSKAGFCPLFRGASPSRSSCAGYLSGRGRKLFGRGSRRER